MKKNVLVFPCGSEIGLDIYSSVYLSTYFHLVGANSVDDHGKFVYEDYVSGIPFVTDQMFIPKMKELVRQRQIDVIYPTMDQVITVLKEHEEELGCMVVSSPVETVRICLSKELTYQKLADILLTPKVYDFSSIPTDAFPVFAKPNIGYGARGTKKLENQFEVDSFMKGKDGMLIMEYLPGEEYTVDCFTDRNGTLLFSAARRRQRIRDGISVNTSFVDNQEEFEIITQKINKCITFRGAWFYQVKRNKDGQLCLLEAASRLGGSSLLSRAIGVNLAQISLFDLLDYPVSIQKNTSYRVELDRSLGNKYRCDGLSYQTVYVDYDDCLILRGSIVNVDMITFLYKGLNEHKRLILLTKHRGDLLKELKDFRLNTLFDEIIHIGETEQKTDYITTSDAIFIDDSFAERERVSLRFNIPVFSPEMIDVFL